MWDVCNIGIAEPKLNYLFKQLVPSDIHGDRNKSDQLYLLD